MEIEENNPLLIKQLILFIFGFLKDYMDFLINEKNAQIYQEIKILLLECIKDKYLKMNNPDHIVRKTISDLLSIIILSGISYHWPKCIEDMINETPFQNIEFCYIVLRALGSIDILINYKKEISIDKKYEDLIKISPKHEKQIKEKLIEKNDLVERFLLFVYNNINTIKNEEMSQKFIEQLFDTAKCWTNFELNLLKSDKISIMIYSIIDSYNIKNPIIFSDMICDSICNSKNSKIYENIRVEEDESIEKLSLKLSKLIDVKEKKGLEVLLNFIFPKLGQLKNRENVLNEYEKKVLKAYASILACIIENYIYFFFNFNDKKSAIMLEWLRYFLKYKKWSISSKFFDGLYEMKKFINDYYRLCGLNKSQKVDFVNYLMDIAFGIMENCSYKKLDQNDLSILQGEIFINNNNLEKLQFNDFSNKNKDLEGYDDDEDIDLNMYRENAKSAFNSIFLIIFENFQDDGTSHFLETLLSPLYYEIIQKKYINDQYLDIKIDVVFFTLFSVLEIFEEKEAKNSINIIHNLIKLFLNTKIILENQKIFANFIILINKFSSNLIAQPENFQDVLHFLLLVSKNTNNKIIIYSCYEVLLNICREINENIQIDHSFIDEMYNLYTDIYNEFKYQETRPLESLIDILLIIVGINKNKIPKDKNPEDNNNFDPNIKYIILKIFWPINNQISQLLEQYEKRNLDKIEIKLEIKKSYFLQEKIIISIKQFSILLRNIILQELLNLTLNSTKKIFKLFKNDEEIIESLLDFYRNLTKDIGESCQTNFNSLNEIIISYFLSTKNKFKIMEILKILYLYLLISKDGNDKLYIKNNKYILDQYYLIMNIVINIIYKENNINSLLMKKINIISDFHYFIFRKLNLSQSIFKDNNELIKYYKLFQEIINFFSKYTNLFFNIDNKNPIKEKIILSIINSFNSFFKNSYLKKDFLIINNNNSNSNNFIDIILSLWKIILFKRFNDVAEKNIIICYKEAIKYDIKLFNLSFKKFFSQIPKFNNLLNPIIEYFQYFQNSPENIEKMIKLIIKSIPNDINIDNCSFNNLFELMSKTKI